MSVLLKKKKKKLESADIDRYEVSLILLSPLVLPSSKSPVSPEFPPSLPVPPPLPKSASFLAPPLLVPVCFNIILVWICLGSSSLQLRSGSPGSAFSSQSHHYTSAHQLVGCTLAPGSSCFWFLPGSSHSHHHPGPSFCHFPRFRELSTKGVNQFQVWELINAFRIQLMKKV